MPCNQSIIYQTCLLHFFSYMVTPTPWEMPLALILLTCNMFQLMSKQKLWFWAHESWPLKAAGMGLLTNLCPGMTLCFATGNGGCSWIFSLATKGVCVGSYSKISKYLSSAIERRWKKDIRWRIVGCSQVKSHLILLGVPLLHLPKSWETTMKKKHNETLTSKQVQNASIPLHQFSYLLSLGASAAVFWFSFFCVSPVQFRGQVWEWPPIKANSTTSNDSFKP